MIGNGYSEAMVGDTSKNSMAVRQTAAFDAQRLIWFLEDEDVMILPSPISHAFLLYVNKTLGKNLTERNFIFASDDPKNPKILTSEVLLDPVMIANIAALCKDKENWSVLPYFHTSSMCILADLLNQLTTFSPNFVNQSGADLLNQKAAFRALFSKHVPIANGAVCRSAIELYQLVHQYLLKSDKLIIKQNMNASGDGNI